MTMVADNIEAGTRERMLVVAERLFREIGYQKTTVADIAKVLRMSPANVYRFFDSKKAIHEGVARSLMGEVEEATQAIAARPGPAAVRLRGILDPAHQGARDALVDRLFRIEKAIDVGRAHPQHLGDVGDGGLLVADFTEQTLRHHENTFSRIGLDMFGNQRHRGGSARSAQCSIIPPPQQVEMRASDAAAQYRLALPCRSPRGCCGTRGRRGPAGTARSGRLQQTIRP